MSSLCVAGDAGQNLIRCFGPDEGLRSFIVDVQIFVDSGLQLFDTAKDSTAYAFVRDFCEPSFHQVDPGTVCRSEVEVKTGSFGEPLPDERCFVSSVVIQHDVDVKIVGYAGLNCVQKPTELQRTMAAVQLADDPAGLQIKRRK